MNPVNINPFILKMNWVFLIVFMGRKDARVARVLAQGSEIGKRKPMIICLGEYEKMEKLPESTKMFFLLEHPMISSTILDKMGLGFINSHLVFGE